MLILCAIILRQVCRRDSLHPTPTTKTMTLSLKRLSALEYPRACSAAALCAALFFAVTPLAVAQTGIGGQIGDPTGITLKFGVGYGAIDLAAGWDLGDHFSAQGHYLLGENRLPTPEADLRFFYGPGAYLKVRNNDGNDDGDADAGFSFNVGLGLYPTREIEIFGQITPRLQLIDETDFDFGGAIGLRYYF